MGTLKNSKAHALTVHAKGKANSKDHQKGKGKKDPDPRKGGHPKPPDGSSGSKERKGTKGQSMCNYCHRGFHPESACMKKTIDRMAQTLQQYNLGNHIPENAKKYGEKAQDPRGNGHALIALHSAPQEWIIDSGASHHMASSKESFSSLHAYSGPPILMGDNSAVAATGQGRVQFEDGSFENVLHIPRLSVNLLSVYQMTHTGSGRKVEFTPDSVSIYDMQTNLKIASGKVNDQSRLYTFSDFVPQTSVRPPVVEHRDQTSAQKWRSMSDIFDNPASIPLLEENPQALLTMKPSMSMHAYIMHESDAQNYAEEPPVATEASKKQDMVVPPDEIPPDERFPLTDFSDFGAHTVMDFANMIAPTIEDLFESALKRSNKSNTSTFGASKVLFNSRKNLGEKPSPLQIVQGIVEATEDNPLINFLKPQVLAVNELAWKTDREFACEALAGVNPMVIQFLETFPLSYSKSRRSSGRMLRETSVRLLSSPPNLQPRDYKADREFESWNEQYRSLSKRRGADFWKKRPMFLHSYQFTIKKTVPERVKTSLRKLNDNPSDVLEIQVAAAKVRRAQEVVVNGRPFSETLVQVLYNLNEQLQTEDVEASSFSSLSSAAQGVGRIKIMEDTQTMPGMRVRMAIWIFVVVFSMWVSIDKNRCVLFRGSASTSNPGDALALVAGPSPNPAGLVIDFYRISCPSAESIIQTTVQELERFIFLIREISIPWGTKTERARDGKAKRKFDFWLFFFAFLCGVGTGMAVINNMGQFLMPAYRGFSFLDPKGRGGSTGYDNAVALPARGRGDEDELAKENIKDVSASKGSITLSVSKSKPETREVIGVFESLQPSDTDLGSTVPKDVKIQGIWYAQIGKALALLALGSAITVTPCEVDSG